MSIEGRERDPSLLGDFYSASAEDYEQLWAPELLDLSLELLRNLPLSDAGAVLESGAGVGALLPHIAGGAPGATVVGADVAEGMIRRSAHRPVAVMDAANLGFGDGSFDVVIMAFMLFHLPNPADGVAEAARVLRAGGSIGTVTWGAAVSYEALDIWNEELDAHGAEPAAGEIIRHESVNDPEKVSSLLKAHGFVETRPWTGAYENRMTPEGFFEHRIGHGVSRWRFETLDDRRRTSFRERVLERVARLDPQDIVQREEVIYATAVKAGA
jgi:ubiquinone/menaquinone biosynthesis C-methylase UbiE